MEINLGNKAFTFLRGYQNEEKYRVAFNSLVEKIFGLSFEAWYQAGYWQEKYIPYSLFDDDKAVANVSVTVMDFNIFGAEQRYVQIGTVLTDESYRNQGLSRFLIKHAVKEWEENCDLIYLFANNATLEMYPKFGFRCAQEHVYFKSLKEKTIKPQRFEKLDMAIQSNRDMMHGYVKNSKLFGKLSMNQNADLVLFYCTSSLLKERVYYSKSLDAIAVATFKNNQLHLWDVFSPSTVELDEVIYSLAGSETKEVFLGFTPKDCSSCEVKAVIGEDILFVQENKTELFDNHKIMFPLLSHA